MSGDKWPEIEPPEELVLSPWGRGRVITVSHQETSPPPPIVDIVVVNYKTPDLLTDFRRSVAAHTESYYTTLTVVDVCPDNIYDPVEPLGNFFYLALKENLGYAQACNIGAQIGFGDVLLLANADTLLSDGLLECAEQLMAHDDWGVLGPRQVNEHGLITAGGIFGTEQSIGQRGWNETDMGQYSDVREDAKTVSGSLYFIKRTLWDELTQCPLYQEAEPGAVGAFLHTPHYYEETFCSYHARAHGKKCVYYGPVQMTHLWHRASVHGGWADQQFQPSLEMYRRACEIHGIEHE